MYSIYAGDELLYSDVYPNNSRKVTSPTLKMIVDGAGSLEFTISEINECYTKLQRMKTIVTVKKFGIPIWDGRVVEETRDFNKNKKMYVEGALAFLNDTTQPIKEYKNKSLEDLVTAILSEHNKFVLNSGKEIYWGGVADDFVPDEIEYWATAYEYTIEAIKKVAEYLECHYIIKKVETEPNSGVYVNKIFFFKEYYSKTNQSITFGKNLLDYTEQYDLSKLATVLLPLAKTDRESADEPNIVGTDLDLTKPLPYGTRGNYGVFMPLTKGVALRNELNAGNQPYSNVPIPPYRNKLNVLLSDVDTTQGTYTVKGADLLGVPDTDSKTWIIPDYVRVWKFASAEHHDSFDDAKNAPLNPDYLSDCKVMFTYFPGGQEQGRLVANYDSSLFDIISAHSHYNYLKSYDETQDGSIINDVWRTHAEMDAIAFEKTVDDYGILTGRHSGYHTAIIEIDISTYKTVYLTASNFVSGIMTMSLWTRDSASDSDPVYTKRIADVYDKSPIDGQTHEGFIYSIDSGKFYSAFVVSTGYKLAAGQTTNRVSDLVVDDDLRPYVLDPDRYSLAKEYNLGTCFSRKVDLNYTLPEGKSNRVLLVISSVGIPNITLVSEADKQVDSTVAIGMNTEGIDVSDTYPKRVYSDHSTWASGFAPGFIYVEQQQPGPDNYLPYSGYGVLSSLTNGVRLLSEQELSSLNYNASLNIFNDGVINTSTAPDNKIIVPVSQTEEDYQEYKVCVLTVRNSYIDENDRKHPNSIYISTELKGKYAAYAIFEFTDGNGNSSYVDIGTTNGIYEAWDVETGPKPQNLRTLCKQPIEFGKYVSGKTVFDGKKITMPYSKDPTRLLMVCIASYGGAPRVYAHDPKLEDSVRYLTISSVNNGDTKLTPDSSNLFGTYFEHGDISNQNGSKSNVVTRNIIRTVDAIDIPADGPYSLSFVGTNVKVRAHIYGAIEDYLGYVDYSTSSPYIVLPYLYKDYKIHLTAIKGDGTGPIATNDISEVMIWSPENARNMLFTQGCLDDTQTADSIEIDISDTTRITTADYYYVKDIKCYLDVRAVLDTAAMPTMYDDGTGSYPIISRSVYITTWYQVPTVNTDEHGAKTISYTSIAKLPEIGPATETTIHALSENIRLRFQIRMVIAYKDNNGTTILVNNVSMDPKYVQSFSVTPVTNDKKDYVVSNKAYQTYGHIEKRIEFEDINSSQELMDRAKKYLNQSQFDEMCLKVKALDMAAMGTDTDDLKPADSINVSSPPHGLYKDFIIREVSIPFDNVANSTFELGFDNKDSLSKLIRKENSKW